MTRTWGKRKKKNRDLCRCLWISILLPYTQQKGVAMCSASRQKKHGVEREVTDMKVLKKSKTIKSRGANYQQGD